MTPGRGNSGPHAIGDSALRQGAAVPEADAWNTCPNCGAALFSRTCKLWCSKNCGYFVSCSEI